MDLRRKWKSLLHKVEHLRLEVEDHNDIIKSLETEFLAALRAAEDQLSPPDPATPQPHIVVNGGDANDPAPPPEMPPPPLNDEVPTVDDVERPDGMRKLWKAIAVATHPDKTGGDPELTTLYKRASDAWARGDFEVLLEVAFDVGIDVPDPDPDLIEVLTKRAKVMAERVAHLESSVLWMWGEAPPEKRDAILKIYLASRKLRGTSGR